MKDSKKMNQSRLTTSTFKAKNSGVVEISDKGIVSIWLDKKQGSSQDSTGRHSDGKKGKPGKRKRKRGNNKKFSFLCPHRQRPHDALGLCLACYFRNVRLKKKVKRA